MVVVNQCSSLAHAAPLRSYRKFPHGCCQRVKFREEVEFETRIRPSAKALVSLDQQRGGKLALSVDGGRSPDVAQQALRVGASCFDDVGHWLTLTTDKPGDVCC